MIFFAVAWTAGATARQAGFESLPGKLALIWLALICSQVVFGAATIWTKKAADIATAHVAVGALSLMVGSMLGLVASRSAQSQKARATVLLTPAPTATFEKRRFKISA